MALLLLQFPLAVFSVTTLASTAWAFVPSTPGVLCERILSEESLCSRHKKRHCRRSRWGPSPLEASAKPGVKDTTSIISEMEDWTRAVTPETYVKRNFKYEVSAGTSLPEVFFDFWKAVSSVVDEHRATGEDRSLRKVVMFVAPFCEELREYETMERAHQLLQQSAQDGGCEDFGKAITHLHYHPNYRYRPKPKKSRMASRHSPHPAFSIDVIYRNGGLKSLASIRAASEGQTKKKSPMSRLAGPPSSASSSSSPEGRRERSSRQKKEEWATLTRSSLENIYNTAASYGAEDVVAGNGNSLHPLAGKGVPESSQEIMQATQTWLKKVLKDAAESDAAAATNNKAGAGKKTSPLSADTSCTSVSSSSAINSRVGGMFPSCGKVATGNLATDRSTAFKPPTAAEAEAAAAAAATEEAKEAATGGGFAAALAKSSQGMNSGGMSEASSKTSSPARFKSKAGGLKEALAHAAERVTVREETRRGGIVVKEKDQHEQEGEEGEEEGEGSVGKGAGGEAEEGSVEQGRVLMPGKELVKRMQNVSQYIVARSRTAEEAYGDVWEVIMGMADRASTRGCSVPTEDYSSRSAPCYCAVMVTPDLATYSSDTFFRFQETLNRGLKHLPMEHDISVEAFHPEAVSESSPLDHRFTRSPFPTLHLCYHGLRAVGTPLHPMTKNADHKTK